MVTRLTVVTSPAMSTPHQRTFTFEQFIEGAAVDPETPKRRYIAIIFFTFADKVNKWKFERCDYKGFNEKYYSQEEWIIMGRINDEIQRLWKKLNTIES